MMVGNPNGALFSFLQAAGLQLDAAYVREALQITMQAFMEIEVSGHVAAEPYERSHTRRTYRNGYRQHTWKTCLGAVPLRIPKLRKGAYYPGFLEHPTIEDVLLDWVHDCFLMDIAPESVHRLRDRLGLPHVHDNLLADMAAQLHDVVVEYRERPLTHDLHALLIADALLDGDQLIALAVGLTHDGAFQLLALKPVVDLNEAGCWRALVRHLSERGLRNVEVLISKAYPGLRESVQRSFAPARWHDSDAVQTAAISPDITGLAELMERLASYSSAAHWLYLPPVRHSVIALVGRAQSQITVQPIARAA
jgi:transposase-like protein